MRAGGPGRQAVAVVVGVVVGLAALVAPPQVAAGPSTVVPHDQRTSVGPLVTALNRVLLSPNGDHRKDRGRIRFELRRPARVVVTVRDDRRAVVVRAPLGRLPAGRHVWTWDGRTGNGRLVQDGSYGVTLRAAAATRTQAAHTDARVDTELRGRLVTTRPTVHPRASVVEDHVQLVWVRDGWSPEDRDLGGDVLATADVRIRTRAGDVVWHRTLRDRYTPAFDWSARRPGGAALPTGRYVARVTVTDDAGNRRRSETDLRVSHAQLVEEVWTTTVAAAEAGRSDYYAGDPGCLGCYDICPPVASGRFAGGLSFRPCAGPGTVGWAQVAHFGTDVPFAAAPVDSFRVTASGGPTSPGSGDVGYVDATSVGPGDASATTPWSAVDLVGEPFLPDRDRPVHWSFGTRPSASYDVATFTVDYRHYVPRQPG